MNTLNKKKAATWRWLLLSYSLSYFSNFDFDGKSDLIAD